MLNSARCPKCDESISNIHYESHDPNTFSGYKGSASFTAVAFPCGHAISAVPVTWEMRLEEIENLNRELHRKLDTIYKEVARLSEAVENLDTKPR